MPIEFTIDPAAGIVTVELEGKLTRDDFLGFFASLQADPRFNETMSRLFITTGATGYPPTSEMPAVVDNVRRRTAVNPPRYAVVADSPLGIGMANMFMGQAGLSSRFEIFADRESAAMWLSAPDTAEGA